MMSKSLGRTFLRVMSGYGQVRALLRTAEISIPVARQEVLRETIEGFKHLEHYPPFKELFAPGSPALEALGGWPTALQTMAGGQIAYYMNAVAAAGLIFAHSVIDAAVSDYCRIVAEVAPEAWDDAIAERKVKFSSIRSLSVDEIRGQLLAEFLKHIDREPLPRRIELLLGITKPTRERLSSEGYTFDADRIVRIDDHRHRLIHGGARPPSISEVELEVTYLEATSFRLMSCLFDAFQIYPDPTP